MTLGTPLRFFLRFQTIGQILLFYKIPENKRYMEHLPQSSILSSDQRLDELQHIHTDSKLQNNSQL